ncbi:MAG: ATP-binding protein [Bacteroidota bacterium]
MPFLVVAFLMIFSIFYLDFYSGKKNDPVRFSAAFQKTILEAEQDVKNEVDLFSGNFGSAKTENDFWKQGLQKQWQRINPGISFFVFKKDSLVFWSDNKIILPSGFLRQPAANDFVLKLKTGWYGFHCKRRDSLLFLGAYLIRNEFPFQNQYLVNRFSSRFNFPEIVSLVSEPGKYPVYSNSHAYLFSLKFLHHNQGSRDDAEPGGKHGRQDVPSGLLFLFFAIGFLSLLRFLYLFYNGIEWFSHRRLLFMMFFFTTVIFLRYIQFYLHFPAGLYDSALFSPSWYSSSVFLPSLGDLTINSVLLFVVALVFFKSPFISIPLNNKRAGWLVAAVGAMLFILLAFHLVGYLITDLVTNSSLPLNLQNISELVFESGYGLFIVSTVLFSFWLISARILKNLFSGNAPVKWWLVCAAATLGFYGLILFLFRLKCDYLLMLSFIIYVLAFFYLVKRKTVSFSFLNMLFFLCFYAVFTTIILNRANEQKENEKLDLLAVKLAIRRNPVTEVMYEQLERSLLEDTVLLRNFQPGITGKKLKTDSLISYLKQEYFKDYWRKYNIQITICDTTKDLRIQPQDYRINCKAYFKKTVSDFGEATLLPNLVFLDYGFGKEDYLAILDGQDFGLSVAVPQAMFIEINLKNTYPDPGYPGLLMDKARLDIPSLSDYSYGVFQNGKLVHAVGNYSYSNDLEQYKRSSGSAPVVLEDRMKHYPYRINSYTTLIISKKEDTFLAQITPFSYLFILFAAIALMVTAILNFPKNFNIMPHSLRNRLHISLIGILVVALLAIGIVQVVNITSINSKKNSDSLRERAFSVLVEVQHRYSLTRKTQDISNNELEDFLIKLSNVFFTDINFYDVKGRLVSSSRPQIFEEGLVSERMDPETYRNLIVDHMSIVMHSETIGNMQFSSAYLPFYNEQNNLLGYINLPYFSRQDELKREISSFLVTFINIYILLILFGVFITILISNYITAPLALLAEKLSRLRLGRVNEKIFWNQQDEIGQLVIEYNRMIDELGKSAGTLARSERESAWREMARQVAHEIKNPLTPMKLSAQYLQKAWNEKAPDWEQRLARFTNTLVEQIDTLSAIASDFSDFARMPAGVVDKVDLDDVIRFVLSLYQGTAGLRYEFTPGDAKPIVQADRSQLIRVFTNLLNNAVQAIGNKKEGTIIIRLSRSEEDLVVAIADNGSGISAARKDKIFQPDFTTKTGGMGLGLAIVKGIVEGIGGKISFTTEEQKGTTFVIKIPAYADRLP